MARGEEIPAEISPDRFIEKVSLVTGEVLDEPVEPEQLLVKNHRDYHIVDVQARRFMSRMVAATGDEDKARQRMREVRRLGHKTAKLLSRVTGQNQGAIAQALFGLKDREYYFRYKKHPASREEIEKMLTELEEQARQALDATKREGRHRLRVLLTGGTGFVGKEILWQAAHDPDIEEMVVVIRPKTIRDRKSGEVLKVISPEERGQDLLHQLWLEDVESTCRFRFVGGDVEQPGLGIDEEVLGDLPSTLTHVIHCAASVAFDDPYEKSYRANVMGTLNALEFSRRLQQAEGSRFVSHLAIETSYIHGRQVKQLAREDEMVFPKNFYNNHYELTKAIASIEVERFILQHRLRVVQLCPAIVIGEGRTGNNRGDTKVVNAPVNLFGRAHEAMQAAQDGSWVDRAQVNVLAKMAMVFPGDPTAQLNLIPVDRVVAGIVAALKKPAGVGRRIHLATDNRLSSREIRDTVSAELGVDVKLAEPTLHRNVTLPVLSKVLATLKQDRMGHALNKLGTIFAGYSEWGQPVHAVGRDVTILGLPSERPNTSHAFRMLCRHNRYVQEFGQVKDLDEISRREKAWLRFIDRLEESTGQPVASLPAAAFQQAIERDLDIESFELKSA